ncbi:MAG TPA: DUF1553 domain-containing protein, partial [Gemmataceae bacterium]|nr:DUF1553 domain-containing protein [Gemmataceae bacterium]
ASLLYQKLAAGKMPPSQPLSPVQLAAFKQWIDGGFPYEREPLSANWWAFRPLQAPVIPHTPFDRLANNPIDQFIFAKLAERGLRPAPPADRLAFLRRVSIDLTGLPPTPEEVEAFLADHSPRAYEHVVDRLLASPAYGERWARHWLDVVRYGESNGYEQNHLRSNAWPYRDYVIGAFNRDIPYPRFIAEQLAGDVLAHGDPEVEAATGFLVAGVHDTVGIQTVEGTLQQRANDLDDIVSTIGATFLGLTVGCAKCHDHKFDPIPQRDYYRLVAVVAGVRHGERPLSPSAASKHEKQLVQLEHQRHRLEQQIAEIDAAARAVVLRRQGVHPVPRPAVNVRGNVEDFAPLPARFVRFTILATRDGSEPCLDELEVYGPDHTTNLALAADGVRASASSLLPGYAIHQIAHLNDGRYGNDWSWISREPGHGWAQIELPRVATVSRIVWSRDAAGDMARFQDRLASRYRVETSIDGKHWQTVATGRDRAAAPEAIPATDLVQALSPAQRRERKRLAGALAHLSACIRRLLDDGTTLAGLQRAYIGQFTTPDAIAILKRGDVMRRGRPVTPGALSELPGFSGELKLDAKLGEAGRRLALADWLADPRNPLTTRVVVNRIWQHHFGRGIVGTPSDFGANGELPTHPELLDWLACDFRAHGSRLKHLHRLIVTSYTYRQSSAVNAVGQAADASNRLLWRMPLERLDAETVHDAILSASGKLDRRMGGPGYRLFRYRVVNVAIYEPLNKYGPATWRRGIYRQSARAIREDLMANFDCPECAQRAPRRDVTTTPLQALSLLNGPFVHEQAELFAARVKGEVGRDVPAQVERAFRIAFGRPCTTGEQKAAVALVRTDGLAMLCRALLNANEFLYY